MKIKTKSILIILLGIISLISCTTSAGKVERKSIYEQDIINNIDTWNISLRYNAITIEEEKNGQKSVKEGNSTYDLQFIDDLYFSLKDEGQINLSRSEYEGIISFHIIRMNTAFIHSIDIQFLDMDRNVLGRIKIGYSGIVLMSNESVMQLVIDELHSMIHFK